MKRYPFSVSKHAHDIEYYRNHLFCTMKDMESGEIPMDSKRYDRIEEMYDGKLQELYDTVVFGGNGRVAYLTGEQIGLAKKIILWASEQRASHLIESGKTEYLHYC